MGFNQQKLRFNQQKLWLWDFLWDNMDHWDWTNKELGVMDNLMIFEDVWEMVLDSDMYPLVMTATLLLKMVIYSEITHWKWWFSIVMLVYQRVSPVNCWRVRWALLKTIVDDFFPVNRQKDVENPWKTTMKVDCFLKNRCFSTCVLVYPSVYYHGKSWMVWYFNPLMQKVTV
jgi:hypothetical protein